MKKIVLLDSHAIIHRAYHAMPEFTARDGTPTGGLFGVCSILISTIAELKPDYIIACYDLPGGTFRHEAYDEYKSGRKKTDSELVEQIIRSRDIFEAFGIPIYEKAGYEADDLLGTLAEILKQDSNNQIIIASGDHDTMQLVEGDQVQIMTPKKGMQTTMYNEKAVVDRYGFGSNFIPDYKGLAGDPSDNIKGIKGVGAKTATNLIVNFGTLEEMYKVLHKDEQKILDAKITPRILGLLKEGEEDALFSKELATIKRDVEVDFTLPEKEFADGLNLAVVGELFRQLEFRTMIDRLQKAMGIKSVADEISLSDRLDIENVSVQEALKYKLAVHLLNPTIADPTIDDILAFTSTGEFNDATKEIEQEIKKLGLEYVWNEIEIPLAPLVAQMDEQGFLIDKKLLEKKSKDFHKKIDVLEKEIHKLAGQEFNIKSTKQLSVVLFENMGLPTKGIKKTPKGVLSTKESELEKIASEHEIIGKILEYRELTKLTSTYIDNIIPMINTGSGRLYSRFLQNGTVTGRMSSKDPNLQNIPTGGDYGKEIREVFIATPGTKLVSCDYSQVELRAAAMLSGDETLVEVFNNKEDIHSRVALEMFGEESADNRRKAKVINFGILYGMGANALRKNLGVETTTLQEARSYLDMYFERFSGVAKYIEETKLSVKETGYSETLYGRKRFFPKINSTVPFIKAMEERMAVNAPIQGTATADIIKLAMIDVSNYITENNLGDQIKILAQVHDELVFEIKEDIVDDLGPKIQSVMEAVLDTHIPPQDYAKVPLRVGLSVGDNWAELK